MYPEPDPVETLDRVRTTRGELVLRRRNGCYEIVSNGVFLMDTSDGSSERLLVDAALARTGMPSPHVLIGGLGVGFSLVAAVAHERVGTIDVAEIEPSIIDWHVRFLGGISAVAREDPRVTIHAEDVVTWLAANPSAYDVVCLDTDNGPNWLVFDANAELYGASGLDLAYASLHDGGVLAVWSASRDAEFEERLARRFGDVEILEVPMPRGVPDVVYVARRGT